MPTVGDILLEIAPYTIGIILTLFSLIIFGLSKQRKLLGFLGVDERSRRVIVYLSSLLIPHGCALGFDRQPRSYQGIAIPTGELSIGTPLSRALTIDPFESIPPVFRKRLQEKNALFRQTKVDVYASPMDEREIDFSTRSIITDGSQGYNVVTNYCIRHNLGQLQITDDGKTIRIVKGKHQGEIISPPSNKHDIAILERIVDRSRNDTTIIIGAGLGVVGTTGAIQYLMDHWQELNKNYGNKEFALVLQFGPSGILPPEELLKGSVVRRLPEV
jgi:hypothetical protein